MRTWVVFLLLFAAGCVGPAVPDGNVPPAPVADTVPVGCRVLGPDRAPLAQASCTFNFPGAVATVPMDANGSATVRVPRGAAGTIQADAPEHLPRVTALVADAPKMFELTLARRADPAGGTESQPTPPVPRTWTAPVTVATSGNEPHIAVDTKGTLYYAPTSRLYRSVDGGATWQDLAMPTALPTLASDTSVSIAPDDSVWFSRTWGYVGGTLACTSTNRGDTWTCDNAAIPGATDRMWIVGLDRATGYVQTNQGLYHHVWAHTTTGSLKYAPYATTTQTLAVRNGNMVFDPTAGAVYQIEWVGATQRLYRVDAGPGLLTSWDTRIPATYALPWLSIHDGVLWTTGEPRKPDGSRSAVLARSLDGGRTWTQFPVSMAPQSVTFTYVAAGGDGRVAAVYYGSDRPGPSTANMGNWSLYLVETDNGLDDHPTWVETRLVDLVHKGNICIGLNCQQNGGDPNARFSGDLIGLTLDADGNAHVAYNDDADGNLKNQYVRQRPA
jgi:hypothetical protein